MSRRPISEKGFPVPWFVSRINGVWDFRQIEPGKVALAHSRKICWLCGEPLGRFLCFVIGPMCSINRISSEPPSHRDCAEYAVRACPFLSKPNMRRNEKGLAGPLADHAPGTPITHNPGASLIWVTKSYQIMRVPNGALFEIGEPLETLWFKEGRAATRAEVIEAIDKGLPFLHAAAAKEPDKDEAAKELQAMIDRAMSLLPAA